MEREVVDTLPPGGGRQGGKWKNLVLPVPDREYVRIRTENNKEAKQGQRAVTAGRRGNTAWSKGLTTATRQVDGQWYLYVWKNEA